MYKKHYYFYFFLLFFLFSCSTSRKKVDVTQYGAVSGDNKSDTEAFIMALKNSKNIFVPPGEYNIDNLVIPEKVSFIGFENKTILKKTKGKPGPILQLEGSHIKIKNIVFIGNLFEEEGEWNHAINIRPIRKSYKNIKIKNTKAIKMHGDGICIGAYLGNAENIQIKNFESDSCYRNGISITAGKKIKVINAKIKNSGMFGVDLEIDNGSKDRIENVTLQDILTCKLAIVGEGQNIIKNVKVKNVILNKDLFANLYPIPGKPPFHPESILLRSCQHVEFNHLTFRNIKSGLIKVIDGADDLNTDEISFLNVYTNHIKQSNEAYSIEKPKHMTNFSKPIRIKREKKENIE